MIQLNVFWHGSTENYFDIVQQKGRQYYMKNKMSKHCAIEWKNNLMSPIEHMYIYFNLQKFLSFFSSSLNNIHLQRSLQGLISNNTSVIKFVWV